MMTKEQNEEFHEKKKHGSASFPFNLYPCTIPGDFPSVPLHWHNSMELIYIKKGHGFVQLDMQTFEASCRDIFVVPPGALHAIREYPGFAMDYENIIFDVEFLGSVATDVCAQEYLAPLCAGRLLPPSRLRPEEPESAESVRQIEQCITEAELLCFRKRRGYELGVKAAMLRLLSLLIPLYPHQPHEASEYQKRLKAVLGRVEEQYARPIPIREMADLCGCSESHFMRWFRQMTGVSFHSYLNERRLAFAADCLRQTDDKILAIAERSGFENLSNFNRQFLARYGVTPRQYRKAGL